MDQIRKELKSRTLGYISAALGLVAGLAWNDAIKQLIETIFPLAKDTIAVKFLYAVLITVAVIVLISYLDRILGERDK